MVLLKLVILAICTLALVVAFPLVIMTLVLAAWISLFWGCVMIYTLFALPLYLIRRWKRTLSSSRKHS